MGEVGHPFWLTDVLQREGNLNVAAVCMAAACMVGITVCHRESAVVVEGRVGGAGDDRVEGAGKEGEETCGVGAAFVSLEAGGGCGGVWRRWGRWHGCAEDEVKEAIRHRVGDLQRGWGGVVCNWMRAQVLGDTGRA